MIYQSAHLQMQLQTNALMDTKSGSLGYIYWKFFESFLKFFPILKESGRIWKNLL